MCLHKIFRCAEVWFDNLAVDNILIICQFSDVFFFQDDSDNVTRFLMLAREPIIPGTDKPFKVSPAVYQLFKCGANTV